MVKFFATLNKEKICLELQITRVVVPEKVEVTISDDNVLIKGPLGEMRQDLKGQVEIKKEENSIIVLSERINKTFYSDVRYDSSVSPTIWC